MLEPSYFAEYILGVHIHEGQRCWLESSVTSENLLVTGNRWGKSFVAAVKILHHLLYRIRSLEYDRSGVYRILNASITQDQAGIIFNQAVRLARQSVIYAPLIESVVNSPFPKMTLSNGATLEARSTQQRGHYLLGHDYDFFLFDEVAFEPEPEYLVEEVIRMRLADRNGKLDLISTPNGKNWFYRRAMVVASGEMNGYLQFGDSRENPFISQEYLGERLQYFSERRIKQNIKGQFVDSGGELLKGEWIDRALTQLQSTDNEDVRYISGWDLARKQTATVGITVAIIGDQAQVVSVERLSRYDWEVVMQRIRQRQMLFPGTLVLDATGLGDVISEALRDLQPETVIFTPSAKADLLTNLELFHASGRVAYSRNEIALEKGRVWALEDELRSVRWEDNNQYDGVMALALALWPLRKRDAIELTPKIGMV